MQAAAAQAVNQELPHPKATSQQPGVMAGLAVRKVGQRLSAALVSTAIEAVMAAHTEAVVVGHNMAPMGLELAELSVSSGPVQLVRSHQLAQAIFN